MKFKDLRKLKGVPADLTDKQLLAWLIIQIFKRKRRRKQQQQAKAIKPGVNPPKLTGFAQRTLPTEAEASAKAAYFKKPDVQPPIQINIPTPTVPLLEAPKPEAKNDKKAPPIPPRPSISAAGLRSRKFGNALVYYDPAIEKILQEEEQKYEDTIKELEDRRKREAAIIKQKQQIEDNAEKELQEAKRKTVIALKRQKEKILEEKVNEYKRDKTGPFGLPFQAAEAAVKIPRNSKYSNKASLRNMLYAHELKQHEGKAKEAESATTSFYNKWQWQQILGQLGEVGALEKNLQDDYNGVKADLLDDRTRLLSKELGLDEPPKVQKGGGQLPEELDTFQIDKIMRPYSQYKGTIAHDEIFKLLPLIKPRQSAAFIINTDNHNQSGTHWQAIDINYPEQSVCFFDSFGRKMHTDLWPGIKLLLKKIDAPFAWKFKENRKVDQDAKSDNCGYFCIEFLVNRFKGKSFAEATKMNEKEIEDFKHRYGPFKLIALS